MLEARIGLEIHVELATRTKMFCRCENAFGAEPNTHCCPVCLALPGALPTVNGQAVRLAVRTALALNGGIERASAFDRKQYEYPDLPKGYQITQYFSPFSIGGEIVLQNGQAVRVHHIHLEEDAGKLLHRGENTRVDYNRCGVPLIEIVTEPDIRTAEDARALLERLRETLVALKVTDGRMQEGSLRADVNVSVSAPGAPLGERVELKNISGFRLTQRAITYEIERQTELLTSGGRIERETRRWDEKEKISVLMRGKEALPDYRYMPEPDLPPLVISEALISEEAAAVAAYLSSRKEALARAEEEPRAKRKETPAQIKAEPLPLEAGEYMRGILADNPNLAVDFLAGKTKVLAYPMGLLVKRFPSADPRALKETLLALLGGK